jgi:hypothetical protein
MGQMLSCRNWRALDFWSPSRELAACSSTIGVSFKGFLQNSKHYKESKVDDLAKDAYTKRV